MSTLNACGDCRDTCAKCHSPANPSTSHGIWTCSDCKRKIGAKCPVCNGSKRGTVGAGKVCKKCYKMNRCTFCGDKI